MCFPTYVCGCGRNPDGLPMWDYTGGHNISTCHHVKAVIHYYILVYPIVDVLFACFRYVGAAMSDDCSMVK